MHININLNSLPQSIVFCRHAESVGNARGLDDNSTREIANHQFGLSTEGCRQVTQTREFLRSSFPGGFAEYYVSSFLRTQITFEGLFGETKTPFEDPRLDEWWKGIFHSLSKAEIAEYYPAEHAVLEREGWYHYRAPQGEAGKDVEMRILSFLNSLTPVESIFICGHGRWYSFLERLLLRLSRREMNTSVPSNCSVIQFTKHIGGYESKILFTPT